jgi:uncharacterized membrane protein YkvA (DUF1232 family)
VASCGLPKSLASLGAMSEPSSDSRYLEMFPAWLRSLGEDAAALGQIVEGDGPGDVRKYVVAGLNYLFKSLDLIPDGIDDLGFLDDAFVIRVAAALALAESPSAKTDVLSRLSDDARAIKEFLGADYVRLETYVRGLRKGAARGRTVEDIMTDKAIRDSFTGEVRAWSKAFQAPSFTRDQKTLVKLKAFLGAKLP